MTTTIDNTTILLCRVCAKCFHGREKFKNHNCLKKNSEDSSECQSSDQRQIQTQERRAFWTETATKALLDEFCKMSQLTIGKRSKCIKATDAMKKQGYNFTVAQVVNKCSTFIKIFKKMKSPARENSLWNFKFEQEIETAFGNSYPVQPASLQPAVKSPLTDISNTSVSQQERTCMFKILKPILPLPNINTSKTEIETAFGNSYPVQPASLQPAVKSPLTDISNTSVSQQERTCMFKILKPILPLPNINTSKTEIGTAFGNRYPILPTSLLQPAFKILKPTLPLPDMNTSKTNNEHLVVKTNPVNPTLMLVVQKTSCTGINNSSVFQGGRSITPSLISDQSKNNIIPKALDNTHEVNPNSLLRIEDTTAPGCIDNKVSPDGSTIEKMFKCNPPLKNRNLPKNNFRQRRTPRHKPTTLTLMRRDMKKFINRNLQMKKGFYEKVLKEMKERNNLWREYIRSTRTIIEQQPSVNKSGEIS